MISVKEYGELLTEIDEIAENNLMDSYIKVGHIQRVIRNFRKKHVALVLPSIKEIVANAYGLTPESLDIETRAKIIKEARHMAMWFYHHYTKKTLNSIGIEFSDGRHKYSHCTVLYVIGKIDDLCSVDKTLRLEREEITKDIEVYYKKVERKKEETESFTMQI
jgi:chromosomal replication initiation ATPase DnaA